MHGRMVGEGNSPSPSVLGTWCLRGLVVLLGVGSRRRRGVLSGNPHGSKLVSAVSVRVVQSYRTKNSSYPLSPPSQTSIVPTKGFSCSVKITIFPV